MSSAGGPSGGARQRHLDQLRAVGIVMVIAVHAVGYCVPLSDAEYEAFRIFVHTASVPVFFLVDGYLFADGRRRRPDRPYRTEVARSFRRLVVPWLVFTVLYTVARYVFEVAGVLDEPLIVGHPWTLVVLRAYGSVYAPQLYFLLSLFLLRLAAPAFARLLRIERLAVLLAACAAIIGIYKLAIPGIATALRIEGGQEPVLHALWGVQYFLLGVVFRATADRVRARTLVAALLPPFAASLLLRDQLGEPGAVAMQYLYLAVLLHGAAWLARPRPWLDWVGRNTMGIYLLHAPVVVKGVSMAVNPLVTTPVASFLVIIALTLLVSVALVAAVRAVPRGPLLFGEPAGRRPAAGTALSRAG